MFSFEFSKVVKTLLQQYWFFPSKMVEFGSRLNPTKRRPNEARPSFGNSL